MERELKLVTVISEQEKSGVYLVMDQHAELMIQKTISGEERAAFYERFQTDDFPFFPRIIEVNRTAGKTILLEEYIEGIELKQQLQGKIGEKEGFSYMEQLLEALNTLHRMNPPIIHRDVKPDNILITPDGALKLLDFDAAREWRDAPGADTICLGTRGYAAPEQYGYQQTDARSDLYSAGIVCSQIAGRMTLSKEKEERIHIFLDKATRFDPGERFQSADEMLRALQRARDGSLPYRIRHSAFGKCALCLSCALLLFFAYWVIRLGRAESIPLQTESTEKSVDLQDSPAAKACYDFDVLPSEYQYRGVHIRLYGMEDAQKYTELEKLPIPYDASGADGFYAEDQECAIGEDYPLLRFMKACPQAILFFDHRLENSEVAEVYLERYSPNGKKILDQMYLQAVDAYAVREGMLCIRATALERLREGIYVLKITARNGEIWEYYLQIHGLEEKIDAFAPCVIIPVQYYSVALQNDAFFSVYNTPFSVERVLCNETIVPQQQYLLTKDGKGVILQKAFFQNWQEENSLELTFELQNQRRAYGRVILIP